MCPQDTTTGLLSNVFKDEKVFLGGSSVGQGLHHAARYYLHNRKTLQEKPSFLQLPGASGLNAQVLPMEDPFYVVDLGIVVSQLYQWRQCFPRVQPFYAIKCCPDPVVIKTLATLGCSFDCASKQEIALVQETCHDLPQSSPEIIYANPCKGRSHLMEAICRGVRMVTFDNLAEVPKCAAISSEIQLILRIITDDRGSSSRLSSKFGASKNLWKPLLAAAKQHGLPVVGVSFHVGSGCRDATRYELALRDARYVFDMAEKEFGMKMTILDIGGGFPGETHSLWNPASELDHHKDNEKVGAQAAAPANEETSPSDRPLMFFTEIAEQVAPKLDELFPEGSGVRIIAEPGRYLVSAASTLVCSVIANRTTALATDTPPEPVNDAQAAQSLKDLTRQDETELCESSNTNFRSASLADTESILNNLHEELAGYAKMFASQQLAQQEVDVYTDQLNLYEGGLENAKDILGPPSEEQKDQTLHTVEGMSAALVEWAGTDETQINGEDNKNTTDATAFLTLAAAGEAAMSGFVLQAVADSAPLQDDYAYYINDGVYGGFNNIMFDHAVIRPRILGRAEDITATVEDGFMKLEVPNEENGHNDKSNNKELFASTVFGPTCDSIDVIARSILLPKLKVGDWLYFQNMGAYTMAAASSFNGFSPTERFYVCSVQPEYFDTLTSHVDNN